jgi:hypothetical protein
MKLFNLLMLLMIAQFASAQIKLVKLDKKSIPASINYVGKIINAVRYTDGEGEHIVVTTETGETKSKGAEDDYRDMALYAYSYRVIGGKQTLSWQVHDFVKECPVDIKANYIPNTFAVTDLNKDGKAEVWLMYTTVCHGDVSPSNMKIIMYEGNKKYAVRGTSKVKISDKEYEGGVYTFDEAFKKGPKSFRSYALQLWKKNVIETW